MDITRVNYEGKCYYSYDTAKEPIYTATNIYNDSIFFIAQQGRLEKFTGFFNDGMFKGLWKSYNEEAKESKPLPFILKPDTRCMPMTRYFYADTVYLPGHEKDLFCAAFSYSLLFPTNESDTVFTHLLYQIYDKQNNMASLIHKIRQESRAYLASHKEEFAESESHYSAIIFNSPEIVVFSYCVDDWYENARTNDFNIQYYSYAVKNKRLIHLKDLFDKQDNRLVKILLSKHFKQIVPWLSYQMPEDVAKIQIPDNYYFTPTGLILVYQTDLPIPCLTNVFIPFKDFGENIKRQNWMQI